MSSLGQKGLALIALALLAVAVLPAEVAADHTYAHRYYITGRVVDAEGFPVSNVTVRVLLDSGTPAGASGQTEKGYRLYVTDCMGNYGWNVRNESYRDPQYAGVNHAYIHVHEPRTSGSLQLAAVNVTYPTFQYQNSETALLTPWAEALSSQDVMASASPELDPVMRRSHVDLHLNVARPDLRCPGAAQEFEQSYRVTGRIMKEIPREERDGGGIVVSEPVANTEVKVTLTYNGGKTASDTVRTDVDGDYSVDLRLEEPLQSGTVRVEAIGEVVEEPADGTLHTTSQFIAETPPWYTSRWARFGAVAGGIALAIVALAYFLNRGGKRPEKGGKKKKNR